MPGWPLPFTLIVEDNRATADGRQLVSAQTSVLVDKYDNVLPDGTQVTLVVRAGDGPERLVPAFVLDGLARAQLQAPTTAGELTVRGLLYDVESELLTLRFAPGLAVEPFSLVTEIDSGAGAVTLVAGPILGPLRQHIPDGTAVAFKLVGEDDQSLQYTAESRDGIAIVVVRLEIISGPYRVEASVGDEVVTTQLVVP